MNEWVNNTIAALGYWGIGGLMLLENLFPPIPSEVIMPLAGFTAGQGKMNLGLAIAAGVIGTILGAIPWYYMGLLLGKERLASLIDRYGKWLGIGGADIEKSVQWFGRHGNKAVFWGRLVPGIRTLISIPAGLSQQPLLPFFVYSTLGTTIWVTMLSYAGYALGKNYHLIEGYMDIISKVVVIGCGLALAGFLAYRFWQSRTSPRA
ncbi:MAG: DedA family protein [Pseudanabaenaceae cyanobacterium bins.68]|nr:DedA family protein [Pseudanabaenaceae cyanobacterium bins.68]